MFKHGDYQMKFNRSGGILLHPSSLPGPYGIGDLGPQAYRFVEWLASTGCKLWQVLPLGPTGYGDSPYQCFSAFAGNPYLISFELLLEDGLLAQDDLAENPSFDPSRVDYGRLIPWKLNVLQKAFSRFSSFPKEEEGQESTAIHAGSQDSRIETMVHEQSKTDALIREFKTFREENASWLNDYALFMSLKEANGGGAWSGWEESLR